MEIISVRIFCFFLKDRTKPLDENMLSPIFYDDVRCKCALLITSKFSIHGHMRMSHKKPEWTKTRACWCLPSDNHGKPFSWRNRFSKCIGIPSTTETGRIYQDVSALAFSSFSLHSRQAHQTHQHTLLFSPPHYRFFLWLLWQTILCKVLPERRDW